MNSPIVGMKICIECLDPDIRAYLVQHLINRGAEIVPKAKLADALIADDFRERYLPARQIIFLATPEYIKSLASELHRVRRIVHPLSFDAPVDELYRLLEEIHHTREPAV